jgi:hypothetical protein
VGQAEDEQTEEEFFHKKAYEEIKRVFCFLRLVCGTVLRVNHFQTQKNGHPLNFYKCWASPKPVETSGFSTNIGLLRSRFWCLLEAGTLFLGNEKPQNAPEKKK